MYCVSTNAQYIENTFYIPPNGVKINDTLFIDRTEISNINYLEFISFVKEDSILIKQNFYTLDSIYINLLEVEQNRLKRLSLLKYYTSFISSKNKFDTIFFNNSSNQNPYIYHYNNIVNIKPLNLFINSLLPDYEDEKQIKIHPKKIEDNFYSTYFRYPGFRDFPVIGITYDQAQNYCKWRTKVVNQLIKQDKKYKDYDIEVKFRLPTISEWELAASNGFSIDSMPYGYELGKAKGSYRTKIKNWDFCQKCLEKNNITTYNSSQKIQLLEFNILDKFYWDDSAIACYTDTNAHFFDKTYSDRDTSIIRLEYQFDNVPSKNGLYNMIGNVAEMVQENGIAKGGAFKHRLKDFNIRTNFNYSLPDDWIGFRCVCVVKIKKKNNHAKL